MQGQHRAFVERIYDKRTKEPLPGGAPVMTVAGDDLAHAAREAGLSLRRAEVMALREEIVPARYLRNLRTLSIRQQARLLESRVCMVGLGGLGGSLLETMVRMGVGSIRAADGDRFEESNLNRQRLSEEAGLSRSKTEMARMRSYALNPAVEFEGKDAFLASGDLAGFLDSADIAVDALGGLALRRELREAAEAGNIPMVSGALAGWTGFVSTVLPGQSCPTDFMGGGDVAEASLGCPAPAVEAVAATMSAEVIRILSGDEPALAGRMLIFDLARMTFETVMF